MTAVTEQPLHGNPDRHSHNRENQIKTSAQPFDVKAINPRYRGAKLSDAARALLRPRNPAARAALELLQGRSATDRTLAEDASAVKLSL